jgi:hypothetical protein
MTPPKFSNVSIWLLIVFISQQLFSSLNNCFHLGPCNFIDFEIHPCKIASNCLQNDMSDNVLVCTCFVMHGTAEISRSHSSQSFYLTNMAHLSRFVHNLSITIKTNYFQIACINTTTLSIVLKLDPV